MNPSAQLLVKLGSLIVHQEEMADSLANKDLHAADFDASAVKACREDPEVVEWLAEMNKMALLPVKRS